MFDKNKKYDIIYADPPWKYGGAGKLGFANTRYNVMSFDELKKLKIPSSDNCLLFMWVVSNKLKDCIDVGEAWGFKFINVGFVWHKPNSVLCGYYTMPSTELCLIFKKGLIPQPRGARNVQQFCKIDDEEIINGPEFFDIKRTTHSKKPEEIANRINEMFPLQSKLEIFATITRDGWDSLGNKIDNSDIREILK